MRLDDAEMYAVYGRRGSGKSYMVKKMMRKYSRIIAFDPMGEYGKQRGWKEVNTLAGLHSILIKNWHKGFKIAYVADVPYVKNLHELSAYIWEAQKSAKNKIMLVAEEMNLGYPSRMKDEYWGFPKLIMQGRHRGVEIIGVTQRPWSVNVNFRSNCVSEYFFMLGDEIDIEMVGKKVGRKNEEKYRNMKPHFYMKKGVGEVLFGKA